jgi:arylsulfatase A-like enzyme
MYRLILLNCLFFTLTAACMAAVKERPPNVIVIFCDDLGYGELPVYQVLYKDADKVETAIGSFTPNLDRLAKDGVICTRAYGHNTCAPSRKSLLSGKWPTRKIALGDQPLIGRHMRNLGLKTAHYGKYHHEVEETITIPYHTKYLEFDEFFGFKAMTNYFRKAGEVVAPRKNSPITYRVGKKVIDYQFPKEGAYLTDTLTDLSVDFINRCSKDKKPFFLYIPFNAPHTPIQAKQEDVRKLFPKQWGQASIRQRIIAMMYAVDRGVGRVINTLEENRQLDRTLIIFTGDNGGEQSLSLNHPLHGFKHEPFDGGIRVPYIVWSKTLQSSKMKPDYYDGLVSICDILPTALKYVDPSTDLESLKSNGTDIMPYLMGQKPPLKGRLYINHRTLNHRSNTWDGGKDTKEKTIGSCIALIADDGKVMKLSQDVKDKSKFSYAFQHLPNMVGKERPKASLKEDYYKDTANNPKKKERMIKQLEELLKGSALH